MIHPSDPFDSVISEKEDLRRATPSQPFHDFFKEIRLKVQDMTQTEIADLESMVKTLAKRPGSIEQF